jgi:hypothetical protein
VACCCSLAPLGLSKDATNPWLPGSDVDPLVLLAWLLLLGGPLAAAVIADRHYTASSSSPPPAGARIRQVMAAGLLVSLSGALLVTVLGTGTTAVMLRSAWLRNWLYHDQHSLYGVQRLSLQAHARVHGDYRDPLPRQLVTGLAPDAAPAAGDHRDAPASCRAAAIRHGTSPLRGRLTAGRAAAHT